MYRAHGTHTPLILRSLEGVFAWTTDASGTVSEISVNRFLDDVLTLAAQLPDYPVAINVCHDRYRFTVAFYAVIVRGQANALPASQHPDVQRRTGQAVGTCYILHDGADLESSLPEFCLSENIGGRNPASDRASEPDPASVPQIPLKQLSAICFTSGSTGDPTATHKSWQTLQRSTEINARYYLNNLQRPVSILATVPPQHMYGLEATVLLPLVANVTIHHAKPLFPADIAQILKQIPASRMLVSTPVHLQALIKSNIELPPISLCLSATAPLKQSLATSVTARTNAIVREIYGCSEAGSLATRDLLTETRWRLFDHFKIRQNEQRTWLSADHLLTEVELQDAIEIDQDGRFHLGGRQSDMVNIAGKRNSLAALTQVLAEMPAVQDCVIFNPEHDDRNTPRLAALIVSETLTAQQVQSWLRERLDHAFVPRSIAFVKRLPRAATGKLPRAEILKTFNETRDRTDDD